jgi:hypothetical protein
MDCELCALEGTSGEASCKCAECGEWLCDMHSKFRPDGKPLCPSCFEAAEEEAVERDLTGDIEELG